MLNYSVAELRENQKITPLSPKKSLIFSQGWEKSWESWEKSEESWEKSPPQPTF